MSIPRLPTANAVATWIRTDQPGRYSIGPTWMSAIKATLDATSALTGDVRQWLPSAEQVNDWLSHRYDCSEAQGPTFDSISDVLEAVVDLLTGKRQ